MKIRFLCLLFCFLSILSTDLYSQESSFSQSEEEVIEDFESDYDDSLLEDDLLSDDLFEVDKSSKKGKKKRKKVYDPLEPVNRAIFVFNDKVYVYIFTPVSKAYTKITPKFARTGVSNFFFNIGSPLRIANNLLQGKVKNAGAETGRFFVNTFLGFLGFIDSAQTIEGLNPPEEDLGQTFGKWGIGGGPYIVIPFMGPSNFRDAAGMAGEIYLDPADLIYEPDNNEKYILTGINALNSLPAQMEMYKSFTDSAFDPYSSAKDAYNQIRTKRIKE
ncbi:MAG: MlaA family lipoprotein [Thermodesulfobacteriota bacterium]